MQTVSGCSLVVSVALCGMSSGHLSVQLNTCPHKNDNTITPLILTSTVYSL